MHHTRVDSTVRVLPIRLYHLQEFDAHIAPRKGPPEKSFRAKLWRHTVGTSKQRGISSHTDPMNKRQKSEQDAGEGERA